MVERLQCRAFASLESLFIEEGASELGSPAEKIAEHIRLSTGLRQLGAAQNGLAASIGLEMQIAGQRSYLELLDLMEWITPRQSIQGFHGPPRYVAHGDLSSGGDDGAGSLYVAGKRDATTGAGMACQKAPQFGHSRQSMVCVDRAGFELVPIIALTLR
jgi:hypothetical protein